jgi:hypothetical protein
MEATRAWPSLCYPVTDWVEDTDGNPPSPHKCLGTRVIRRWGGLASDSEVLQWDGRGWDRL